MTTVEAYKISAYKLTINLNEEDAVTLMGAFQNPIWGQEDTPESIMKLQENIFDALQKLGIKPR